MDWFNAASPDELRAALRACCAADARADRLIAGRPYPDEEAGTPARDIAVTLESCVEEKWQLVASGRTDVDGRIRELGAPGAGTHRIRFATGEYFRARAVTTFYPEVSVTFEIVNDQTHHHVPPSTPARRAGSTGAWPLGSDDGVTRHAAAGPTPSTSTSWRHS
ncbi:hydroxyisourate hydrolase [Dactylosporangium sp. CA-092794]|uniref:hydroxyisourate hydrolase n=1 Tax=Dactylosporangium sp. CA-092794 TaxID=3239929 RepID=UPI003D912162